VEVFKEFLDKIVHPDHRLRTEEVLGWVAAEFPELAPRYAWNQPMFTDHGTFIIGFSTSQKHLAVAPERAGIVRFADAIVEAGYEHSKMLVRLPWEKPVDYDLLRKMIEYNRTEKADCTTFWRK